MNTTAVIEVVQNRTDDADRGLNVAKVITGTQAFTKYDWLKNVPFRNTSGNFRGMVVSKQWAVRFHFVEKSLSWVKKAGIIANVATQIAKSYNEVNEIIDSKADWTTKGSMLSAQVSSIAMRVALADAMAGEQTLIWGLRKACQGASYAGLSSAADLDGKINAADTRINSTIDTYTDGKNIYIFIEKYLVIQ